MLKTATGDLVYQIVQEVNYGAKVVLYFHLNDF